MKLLDFVGNGLSALPQNIFPIFEALCGNPPKEFDSFNEVLRVLYGGNIRSLIPNEKLKELLDYPVPQVIQGIECIVTYLNASYLHFVAH